MISLYTYFDLLGIKFHLLPFLIYYSSKIILVKPIVINPQFELRRWISPSFQRLITARLLGPRGSLNASNRIQIALRWLESTKRSIETSRYFSTLLNFSKKFTKSPKSDWFVPITTKGGGVFWEIKILSRFWLRVVLWPIKNLHQDFSYKLC